MTARLPGYLRLTAVDRPGWSAGAHVRPRSSTRSGSVGRRWPLPDLTLAVQDRPAVAMPQGVLLANDDWTFTIWNDER